MSKLAEFHNVVARHLNSIAERLPEGMQLAFVAYDPCNPELDILIISGAPEDVKAAVERRIAANNGSSIESGFDYKSAYLRKVESISAIADFLGMDDSDGSDAAVVMAVKALVRASQPSVPVEALKKLAATLVDIGRVSPLLAAGSERSAELVEQLISSHGGKEEA